MAHVTGEIRSAFLGEALEEAQRDLIANPS
jgi:hypothetical protein